MSNKHSGSSKMKVPPKKTNEDIEKLDHRSHILKLPDTYLGSIENDNDENGILIQKIKICFEVNQLFRRI